MKRKKTKADKKRDRKWYLKNRNRLLIEQKRLYRRWKKLLGPKRFFELNQAYVLKYRYGLTPDEVIQKRKKQKNRCKLCGAILIKFVIDHDHKCCSGRRSCGSCIRGILCVPCNMMLGQLERILKIGLKKVLIYIGRTQ